MTTAALIFDLDGLLADSEPLHCASYQVALAEFGLSVSEEEYADHWTRLGHGIAAFLLQRGSDADPKEVRSAKTLVYARLVAERCAPMPGALALLDRVAERWPTALATSAYRDSADAVLNALGIADRFTTIVTLSDGVRAKPAPDLFLLAAERLSVSPARCIVFEDAEKGVRAARAAGMPVIAVPNAWTRDDDFTGALVLASLEDVTDDLLAELLPPTSP